MSTEAYSVLGFMRAVRNRPYGTLTPEQRLLAQMLALRVDSKTGEGWATHQTLADDCGWRKPDSVARHRRGLIEQGWITLLAEGNNYAKRGSRYRLNMVPQDPSSGGLWRSTAEAQDPSSGGLQDPSSGGLQDPSSGGLTTNELPIELPRGDSGEDVPPEDPEEHIEWLRARASAARAAGDIEKAAQLVREGRAIHRRLKS